VKRGNDGVVGDNRPGACLKLGCLHAGRLLCQALRTRCWWLR
jgi:hypothetical protein